MFSSININNLYNDWYAIKLENYCFHLDKFVITNFFFKIACFSFIAIDSNQ